MIFKKNTLERDCWWHKIFLLFTGTQKKNKLLTPVKKLNPLHTLFIFFKHKKNGVVALEIALILSPLLILIMGILEFSIIFSIRSGIEEASRDILRQKSAIIDMASRSAILFSDTNNDTPSDRLHTRLTNILPNPENTQVCTSISNTLAGLLATNTFRCDPPYKANRAIKPPQTNMGNPGQYVMLKIIYKHKYLTPLGGILKTLGNDLTFTTVTYARIES